MNSSITMLYVLLTIINTVAWYAVIYYALYAIKRDVSIPRAAFILLILFSLAVVTCPIIMTIFYASTQMAMHCMQAMPAMMQ